MKLRLKNPFRRKAKPSIPPGEMTLVGHLTELRTRLIRSVIAIVVAAIVIFIFFKPIFGLLQDPYCQFRLDDGQPCELIVTSPLESFNVQLTLAGYGGLILALPVILYQMGRFVLPGLYPNERRALLPFAAISMVLMLIGMASAYFMLPRALAVLAEFGSETFVEFFRPSEYLSFFVKMLLAFGIATQLPLVLIFLQKVGMVKPETLAGNRRIAIVAVVFLGAVITPTGDPFTLAVISIPMYVFYEIAIVLGKRMKPIVPEAAVSSSA